MRQPVERTCWARICGMIILTSVEEGLKEIHIGDQVSGFSLPRDLESGVTPMLMTPERLQQ